MTTILPNIEKPELFFGFVGAVGANLEPTIDAFRAFFVAAGYNIVPIKVTDAFRILEKTIDIGSQLDFETEHKRILSHIKFGNKLRSHFGDQSIMATIAIENIAKRRPKTGDVPPSRLFNNTVYFIRQFKRKEEIELLRSVYGRLFFQVSIYSRRTARVDALSRKFAEGENSAQVKKYRSFAEDLIQVDEDEIGTDHGQQVGKIFHDADLIVNTDSNSPDVNNQVNRFCELVFGCNRISPTKHEYGMFLAKAAALRTLDLSRQVGAAIFSEGGEVICLGSNEVPKAGGGTYWSDDEYDDREYRRGLDSNDKRKNELLREVLQITNSENSKDPALRKKLENSQFMDALEYGRIVHAEMSAISDAARNGRALKDSILYSTTFPCHICAKHIVAAGIKKVVFLEPYPKSLASELHSDSIEIEGSDRGRYAKYPAVKFEHFYGVTPRRYRELFERTSRKEDGKFLDYQGGKKHPYIEIKFPFYVVFEEKILGKAFQPLLAALKDPEETV